MKVLAVDDERKFISALAKRLTFRGIQTKWACSGDEAIALVRADKFDVALLDIKMPGVAGIDLKRRLEEIDQDIKFIFITGHGSYEDFKTGSTEASSYLVKPVKIEYVIEKIYEALNEK